MEVEAKKALEIIKNNGDLLIIDVRTPGEFEEGHLNGAVNMDVNSHGFEKSLRALDKGKKYLVYCLSGVRGRKAAGMMDKLGFKDCSNVSGGLKQMEDAGVSVIK